MVTVLVCIEVLFISHLISPYLCLFSLSTGLYIDLLQINFTFTTHIDGIILTLTDNDELNCTYKV